MATLEDAIHKLRWATGSSWEWSVYLKPEEAQAILERLNELEETERTGGLVDLRKKLAEVRSELSSLRDGAA